MAKYNISGGTYSFDESLQGDALTAALQGLSESITSDQVADVFINGFTQQWRPMDNWTLMIIPTFPQEAQRVVIQLKVPAGIKASETFKPLRATLPPPKHSWGFTSPETRREAAQ